MINSELQKSVYRQVCIYGPLTIKDICKLMNFESRRAVQTILEGLMEQRLVMLEKDIDDDHRTTYLWKKR